MPTAAASCGLQLVDLMTKYYELAGVGIAVRIADELMYTNERYMAPYRVEMVSDPHVFDFELVESLPEPAGNRVASGASFAVYQNGERTLRYIGAVQENLENAYMCVMHYGREHRVFLKRSYFPEQISAKIVLSCIAAEHLIAQNGGFIFHSSYIEIDGKAVLFTAPSQTGKSTQADLWHRLRGAAIHNGDRSAVRWVDGQAWVYGIPFSGSSGICENVTLPLSAIVYLKQAPQTTIRRLRGAESFRRVWEGCSVNTWDRNDVDRISETVMAVLSAVPVYELSCTPDESAIIALEGVLNK